MLGREEVSYSEKPGGSNTYKEADNCGTRQDTVDAATAYWMARTQLKKKEPFILYSFASESDACASLLELPCIQVAADTGNMICTEVLTFGCYYSSQTSRYEAALCGQELKCSMSSGKRVWHHQWRHIPGFESGADKVVGMNQYTILGHQKVFKILCHFDVYA